MTGQFPREAYETIGMNAAEIEAVRQARKEIALGSEYDTVPQTVPPRDASDRRQQHAEGGAAERAHVGLHARDGNQHHSRRGRLRWPPPRAGIATRNPGHDWRAQLGRVWSPRTRRSRISSPATASVCRSRRRRRSTLCPALAGRLMEIENVVVNHGAAVMNWDLPGLGERFRLESMYLLAVRSRALPSRRRASSRRSSTIAPVICRRHSTISTCI